MKQLYIVKQASADCVENPTHTKALGFGFQVLGYQCSARLNRLLSGVQDFVGSSIAYWPFYVMESCTSNPNPPTHQIQIKKQATALVITLATNRFDKLFGLH